MDPDQGTQTPDAGRSQQTRYRELVLQALKREPNMKKPRARTRRKGCDQCWLRSIKCNRPSGDAKASCTGCFSSCRQCSFTYEEELEESLPAVSGPALGSRSRSVSPASSWGSADTGVSHPPRSRKHRMQKNVQMSYNTLMRKGSQGLDGSEGIAQDLEKRPGHNPLLPLGEQNLGMAAEWHRYCGWDGATPVGLTYPSDSSESKTLATGLMAPPNASGTPFNNDFAFRHDPQDWNWSAF